MSDKLTDKEFWIHDVDHHHFRRHDKGHTIDKFINKYIPPDKDGSCLKIGSFPGHHLPAFGDLGYTLTGLDFHPLNKTALRKWLQDQNYLTEDFITGDFFEYRTSGKYDVVASFGFIEHFVDYKNVILRHATLVADGGYLMITTPNFRGSIQNKLHRYFDSNNLSMHNVNSMEPGEWEELLLKNGFEILYRGFFGGFWFWHGHEQLSAGRKKLLWITERLIIRIRKLLWFESRAFSAYAGIVARKRNSPL